MYSFFALTALVRAMISLIMGSPSIIFCMHKSMTIVSLTYTIWPWWIGRSDTNHYFKLFSQFSLLFIVKFTTIVNQKISLESQNQQLSTQSQNYLQSLLRVFLLITLLLLNLVERSIKCKKYISLYCFRSITTTSLNCQAEWRDTTSYALHWSL